MTLPTYLSPGVYIEEIDGPPLPDRSRPRPLRAAEGRRPRGPRPTWVNEHSIAAFVGLTEQGPIGGAHLLSDEKQFAGLFGPGDQWENPLAEAVHGFFANGGRFCYVVRVGAHDSVCAQDFVGDITDRTGLGALDAVPDVSTVCAPDVVWLHRKGVVDLDAVQAAQLNMISHCERMGDRVAILDPPGALGPDQVREWLSEEARYDSRYAALYYPWVMVFSARRGRYINVPPCGHVAGVWAAVDRSLGPHAPAVGRPLVGVFGLETTTLKGERDMLHPIGVNVLGHEPGWGITIQGGRSLSSDPVWRHLHHRRLTILLKRNLATGMSWVLRAGSAPVELLAPVREHVEALLTLLWRGGALRGDVSDDAFSVRCDRDNNPAESLDVGQVVAEVNATLLDGGLLTLRVVHVLG